MWKTYFALVLSGLVAQAGQAADLSALEQRWLQGMAPVIAFAKQTKFPLRIVVQPQPTPGMTPLGMAFVDGRCELVLSMRGNPRAQTMLDQIEPALLDATLELMAAHELGHCKRYLEGTFVQAPVAFNFAHPTVGVEPTAAAYAKAQATAQGVDMVRREEAYGDLVGLAWTRHRHPELYAVLHGWLVGQRSSNGVRDTDHDTTAWLQLVSDSATLADPSLFENVAAVWAQGLQTAP